ncbi:hypothetical protein ABZZ79_27185 [Streptomyces sp. NPDC006458]|uniref:hypothetical protein n=1 Tax=Streptomyces sp. NPDC006458 TaxID=3154302 RepID=UPI0033AAA1B4
MNAQRRRRSVAVALAAVALSAVLTGCKGDEAKAVGGSESATPVTATPVTATPAGDSSAPAEGAEPTASAPAGGGKGGASAPPSEAPSAKPAADCVTAPPNPEDYDPDEFALYGYEEIEGVTDKVNLIVQHGAWGCGEPDTDGAPFVVSGEESRWAMDQGAYITATNPIVESTENQRIGVQELLDWLDAHPDSGLVFKYETGDDGAIHRLDEVFTP